MAVVAEHVAGDDQGVEVELIGARDARQRARRASLIAGNRPLGAERSERDEIDVRTSPGDFALDDAAQGNLAEFAGIERPEEPDHRPLCGPST